MPQLTEPDNLPPPPYTQDGLTLSDTTLRQTIHVSVGASRLRLRFSNAFGGTPLPLSHVRVAQPASGSAGARAIEPGTSHAVTFRGSDSVTVPVGSLVVSDPVEFDLAAQSNVAISVYLPAGQPSERVTSHPGSRTTSYVTKGDHADDRDLPDATAVEHWYFLSALDVWAGRDTAALAVIGDSFTDGRGSTTNGNDRWPDQLLGRLRADPRTANVAVINQGAGGNRVLNDGLGPSALSRLDRDILAQPGVRWLIVFIGVNDIGTAGATKGEQAQVAKDLIDAYDQIMTRVQAHDIQVVLATLPPFGGNDTYDDAGGWREGARHIVNSWIRASGPFLDFDAVTRDPADPARLLAAVDTGDHLHLNPAGYQRLAAAVPLEWFTAPSEGRTPY
jgi:lysophospholipase L1-like esterase